MSARGAIGSEQRVTATRPVVEPSDEGARLLGRAYWLAVRRASRGLVRSRRRDDGVELRLLGLRPALFHFGPEQVTVDGDRVSCSYPIRGGVLVRRAGGTLELAQTGRERPELSVSVEGFFPRLGLLYEPWQLRLHMSASRRYFSRLTARAER